MQAEYDQFQRDKIATIKTLEAELRKVEEEERIDRKEQLGSKSGGRPSGQTRRAFFLLQAGCPPRLRPGNRASVRPKENQAQKNKPRTQEKTN